MEDSTDKYKYLLLQLETQQSFMAFSKTLADPLRSDSLGL